ncbi:MAG: hypothetical protein JWM28_4494 [Chitinophagaceae bacterium]|nr:hypothetical protein [Chitinophagaceae bacterium]
MAIVKSPRKTKVEPDYEQEPFETDVIICPKCSLMQSARIFPERKVFKYLHKCIYCSFVIHKKDWKSIQ